MTTSTSEFGDWLYQMDNATAQIILQQQLSDIEEMNALHRGKAREDAAPDDASMAAALLRENLNRVQGLFQDRRMARSIANAVQTDSMCLMAVGREEEIAREDHALARRMTMMTTTNNDGSTAASDAASATSPTIQAETLENAILAKLAGTYVSESLGQELFSIDEDDLDGRRRDEKITAAHDDGGPESSSSASLKDQTMSESSQPHRCAACHEHKRYFDIIASPCGHEYCRECLRELFDTALTDESLFPPRCCRQVIPVSRVSIFLTGALKQRFEEKKVEFGTLNRTYCSRPLCSIFIPLDRVLDVTATCPDCNTQTCVNCKAAAHGGDCPQDMALQSVLTLANENAWQRCYACRRLVELDHGCNHITLANRFITPSFQLTTGDHRIPN